MKKYFTASPISFLDDDINIIPSDAVEITQEQWQSLLESQSKGLIIKADLNGNPVAVNPPGPTYDQTVINISNALQATLDTGAINWGYNSIVSAASYAASINKQYAADAAALIGWRDEVWAWATPQFPNVAAGESPATFMATMPAQPEQPKVS